MTDTGLPAPTRTVWWLVLLRGVLAVLFGLVAQLTPSTALLALVFAFGAYALLDGITAVAAGVRHRRVEDHWVWQVVLGVVSIVAGVVAFARPGATALTVLFLIASWSLVGGIAEVVEALAMRRRGAAGRGWTLAAGGLGVLFGVLLLAQPDAWLLTLLWMVGAYALVYGVILIVWAIRLRRG